MINRFRNASLSTQRSGQIILGSCVAGSKSCGQFESLERGVDLTAFVQNGSKIVLSDVVFFGDRKRMRPKRFVSLPIRCLEQGYRGEQGDDDTAGKSQEPAAIAPRYPGVGNRPC